MTTQKSQNCRNWNILRLFYEGKTEGEKKWAAFPFVLRLAERPFPLFYVCVRMCAVCALCVYVYTCVCVHLCVHKLYVIFDLI